MKEEKLKRFVNDEVTFEVVFERIQKFFMKRKTSDDVNFLAATTLSLYNLEDAKRDFTLLRNNGLSEKKDGNISKQLGM